MSPKFIAICAVASVVVLAAGAGLVWFLHSYRQNVVLAPQRALDSAKTPTAPQRPSPTPPQTVAPPQQRGEATWDRAQLGQHQAKVQACADADPASPRGVLRVRVTLAADGKVKHAEVADPKFRDLDVARCVEATIAAQRFSPGADGRRASHNFRIR